MEKTTGSKLRKVIRNMGARSAAASLIVFLFTVAVTCMVGYQFYRTTKENIHLQGHINAVESAREFDNYLLVRKNTVMLAGHVVDEMIREGLPHEEILEYMTNESQSIKKSIDKDYTGLYGWISGEYCDGDGWVPDDDYVPPSAPGTSKPWPTTARSPLSGLTWTNRPTRSLPPWRSGFQTASASLRWT